MTKVSFAGYIYFHYIIIKMVVKMNNENQSKTTLTAYGLKTILLKQHKRVQNAFIYVPVTIYNMLLYPEPLPLALAKARARLTA